MLIAILLLLASKTFHLSSLSTRLVLSLFVGIAAISYLLHSLLQIKGLSKKIDSAKITKRPLYKKIFSLGFLLPSIASAAIGYFTYDFMITLPHLLKSNDAYVLASINEISSTINDLPKMNVAIMDSLDNLNELGNRFIRTPESCRDLDFCLDLDTGTALYLICQNIYSAENELQEANYAMALEIYIELMQLLPDHPILLYNAGFCSQNMNNIEESIEYYIKAIHNSKLSDTIYSKARFNLSLVYFELSQHHYYMGNIDSAIFYIKKSIDENSEDALSKTYYSSLLCERGKPEDFMHAIYLADDVIATTYDYALPWRIKGFAYFMLKLYEDAASAYATSLSLDSNRAHAYFGLGSVYMKQGKIENAVMEYRKAIERDSNYAEAYSHLGMALSKLDSLDRAISAYDKSIQIDPENCETHYNRGIALLQKEKYRMAIDAFNMVLELNQNYTIAYYNIGTANYEMDELDTAIIYFGTALKLKPEVKGFRYKLEDVCREYGMSKKEIENHIDSILRKPQDIS